MDNQLSPTVQALIADARIISFSSWLEAYGPGIVACFQAADDQGRYLTAADDTLIAQAQPALAPAIAVAANLREQANTIVDAVRQQLMAQFPGITEVGGDLYPAPRAEACWRDHWHFLRCITYAIAAQRLDYLSPTGLEALAALYQAMAVPLPAMIFGLTVLKTESLNRIQQWSAAPPTSSTSPSDTLTLAPQFDCLIAALTAFQDTLYEK